MASMTSLKDKLRESIRLSLTRHSADTPSKWASLYRMMGQPIPGPFGFKYHPWLRAMHDSKAWKNVGMKAAQMGFTECALNRTFYYLDVRRTDCLYILPNKTPDASDFSAARFDPALELSPHLRSLFSDVKNVGHKRAGSVNLYIRGSRSRGGLKSVPVGHMSLDEYDEMDRESVNLAIERMSGQFEKSIDILSTPTIPDIKIDGEFKQSTQQDFSFRCPSCNRFIILTYPDCFVLTAESLSDSKIHDSHLICPKCKAMLPHEGKWKYLESGVWVPRNVADPDVLGWAVGQLYSSTITPADFARSALRAQLDPTDETEFYNSKLGLPHLVKGSRIDDEQINACIGDYHMMDTNDSGLVTMGVDVGSFLHVWIDKWKPVMGKDINTHSTPQAIHICKIRNFEDLDKLMKDFQIHFCVVDMQPEMRKAKEFADRFYGYVKVCYYGKGQTGRSVNVKSETEDEMVVDHQITVNRTTWLDTSLSRFINKTIILPIDTSDECKNHLKSPVRVYKRDEFGNPVGRYENTGPDHFAHARTYSEIALPFAASAVTGSDVTSFL